MKKTLRLALALVALAAPSYAAQMDDLTLNGTALASLGTPANGKVDFCSNCAAGSNPCAVGSPAGALAVRQNGAWYCGIDAEQIQDAVGSILVDTATLDFMYNDGTPSITGAVLDSPLLGGSNGAFYQARGNHTGSQSFTTISPVATDRLLGRDTAGSGATEEIPLDSTLEFTGGPGLRRAAITSDISIPVGSNVATLPSVNGNVGSFQGITVNAKGQVTAAANQFYLTGNQTITLSGDVTGSGATAITTVLANIPSGVTMAGSLLATNIAAPGTPASGKNSFYFDSTSKNMASKNDAGTVNHGAQTKAVVASFFLTGLSDAGVFTTAQPAFSDLTGSATCAQHPALTGDATTVAGNCAVTNVNLPSGVTQAGSLLQTAIAAPGTPAAGKGSFYLDSTSKNMAVKDDAGVVKHGVQTKAVVSNQFLTGLNDAGVVTGAQPAFSDLSSSATCAQLPALTGDVSTSAGTCGTAVGANKVLDTMLRQGGATSVIGRSANSTGNVADVAASSDGQYLRRLSGTLGFGTIPKANYDAVVDFGFVGDLREKGDGACSTGANTKVTSATIAFTAADLNKRITLVNGGASSAMLAATISNIDSATQVTISGATCGTTASSKTVRVGTDNATAAALLVSTMNALTYPGGRVVFPSSLTNWYGTSGKLGPFTKPVILEGQGRAVNQDGGDYTQGGGTWLAWWGTDNDGGTAFDGFVSWVAPTGASAMHLAGAGLRNLNIDCRNGDQNPCAIAVKQIDNVSFTIENVFIQDALSGFLQGVAEPMASTASTGRGIISNVGGRFIDNTFAGGSLVTLTPTTITAGSNNQVLSATPATVNVASTTGMSAPTYFWMNTHSGYPVFVKCTSIASGTSLGGCSVSANAATDNPTLITGTNVVQASPNNGACVLAEGSTTANTNLYKWTMGQFSTGTNWGAACFELHNADSLVFEQVVINGGSATVGTGVNLRATRPGFRFSGSAVGLANASRNNVMKDGDAGAGGVEALAVNSAGTKLTAPSGPNYWTGYQLGNGAPGARIESGAMFDSLDPNGGPGSPGLKNFNAAGQTPTAATLTALTGTPILLGPQGFQVGSAFQWVLPVSKGATGSAGSNSIFVKAGATGGTGDATIATCVVTPTAAIDHGTYTVTYAVTAVGVSATGVGIRATNHFLSVTGLATVPHTVCTPTTFNSASSAFQYVSLSITTGTGETILFTGAQAYVIRSMANGL